MIQENTKLVFEKYQQILLDKKIVADDLTKKEITDIKKMLPHALWMCNVALKKDNAFSLDKLSRWLGFVQCILIFNGLTTIEAERNVTRPWAKGE